MASKAGVPVTFDKIVKSFGPVRVLEELSLNVAPGEFLVLLGASGSGKTTALRIMAGLETASSGRIMIGDREVTEVLPKYRDVSMVFQSYALYPHKTVAENIGFPLKVRKVPKEQQDAAIRDAAAQVQIDQLLERYPRQLSGGQRQRVALGPRHGAKAFRVPHGRAPVQPRCQAPRPHARGVEAHAVHPRHHHDLCHA